MRLAKAALLTTLASVAAWAQANIGEASAFTQLASTLWRSASDSGDATDLLVM